MKTQTTRNAVLGLIGLLALTIYILACTSFSPDDTKVLYPAFSGTNGTVGVAVYDRETKRSEMVFLPMVFEDATNEVAEPQLLRPQWLADGRRILVSWPADNNKLNLALLPWGGTRGAFKIFSLPKVEPPNALMVPLALAGDRAFIATARDMLARLDLRTGAITRHKLAEPKGELSLYPDPAEKGVYYVEDLHSQAVTFGRLDPENFSQTPLITFTNNLMDGSFFTYDYQGKRVAFIEKTEDRGVQLVVLEQGKSALTRRLDAKVDEARFGNAVFTRDGNTLVAACQKKKDGSQVSYELMEIPLGSAPIRETILLPAVEVKDDAAAYYMQVALSHDGKTAAASSTYVACAADKFKPEDCALFFVDLSDPNRKVTKVPIPLPTDLPTPAGTK